MTAVSTETVQAANWAGCIPTVVSLAPTSLSSPTIPPPVHILLPRHSFLHVGLRSAVLRLASFAPLQPQHAVSGGYGNNHNNNNHNKGSNPNKIIRNEDDDSKLDDEEQEEEGEDRGSVVSEKSNNNNNSNNNNADTPRRNSFHHYHHHRQESSYPICWFEDEEGQVALRWHLFAGVLYDMTKVHRQPRQQQQQQQMLPWKIRLHFTSYPHGQLLPFDQNTTLTNNSMDANGAAASNNNHHHDAGGVVLTTLQRSFKHSLKQALFLQHGNSRISLNLTKQSYERIWESILAANYSWYRQVNSNELQVMSNSNNNNSNNSNSNVSISNVHMLPIRLFVDSQPPQQRPCRPIKGTSCASAASTRQYRA
jgi:hypothetical protein